MRRTFAILLAAGVLIAYDSWVLLFLSPHPQPLAGYLSELAAVDQPHSWVFRTGDVIAGTLMILIAVLGARGWERRFGRFSVWVSAAIGLTGLATIADALAALPCTQTFDSACSAEYAANPLRPDFLLHTIASSIVALAALSSMVLALIALRRRGRAGTPYGITVAVALGLLLAANLSSVIIEAVWRSGQGYVQAIAVLIVGGWAAHLGHAAVTDRGARSPETARSPGGRGIARQGRNEVGDVG